MLEHLQKLFISALLICFVFLLIPNLGTAKKYTFVSLAYAPYSYHSNSTLKGLDVELLQECFRRMGEDLKILLVPWKRALYMGMNGQADGVFSILYTSKRGRKFFYSSPVRTETMALYVCSNSTLEFNGDLHKLKGLQLGVVRNFSYGEKFDRFVKNEVSPENIEISVSPEMSVTKLLRGRFDVMVGDKISTMGAINKLGVQGQLRQLGEPISINPIYVAFSKRHGLLKLRDRFNAAFESMYEDGTWERIMSKYGDSVDHLKDYKRNEVE
ncbi:transporter substrate-binding domain-containing protein [Maridesulfovibrio sp.]|uniref:substrate-binding periplasmic protein n=1 Tax=Maridesulfovibrio sp. TaxID=2795000 RepID=UPI0029F58665|nr:transporter substrate-binding domain-containing protein [Maridesulfovibrio sp.]